MTAPTPVRVEGVLERFLAEAVADDYANVPAGAAEHGGRVGARALMTALVVALIGVLVVVAVASTRASDALRQSTRAALVERVSALSIAVDDKQADVDAQTTAVDALRAEILSAQDAGGLAEQSDVLAGPAAADAVAGPGVVVTVDDAPQADSDSLNRVLDRDLQDIVNALWRGGAAAVAVNDQRLTSTTAVRSAGEAILVNFQPLTRPYRITAVPKAGRSIDVSGTQGLLSLLASDYGLVTDLSQGDVALPAGTVRPMRYATPTEGDSAP